MNSQELEELKSSIKNKVVFKYKPYISTSFKTNTKESQMIPLCLEVCRLLKWETIQEDQKNITAIRHKRFGNTTEHVFIKTSNHNKIHLHSRSLRQRFLDFGNNNRNIQLFITLFQKLEKEYKHSGKLEELETLYNRKNNWEDYKIPETLPPSLNLKESSFKIPLYVGGILSIITGILIAFLNVGFDIQYDHLFPVTTIVFGTLFGYSLAKILMYANYDHKFSKKIQYLIGYFTFLMCAIYLLTEYGILYTKQIISGNFYNFIIARSNGTIGTHDISQRFEFFIETSFFLLFTYYFIYITSFMCMFRYMLHRIPEEVSEYVLYLHHINTPESTIRIKLAEKGWSKKTDQDAAIEILEEYK